MKRLHHAASVRGFTLIELLITLVIVSVGMLGLAKLEAAAVAESGVSRIRSLMTYQAESLAAMMRANRNYWGSTTGTAPNFKVAAGNPTPIDNAGTMTVTTTTACTGTIAAPVTPCPVAKIAYVDVLGWTQQFVGAFPNGTATDVCTVTAGLPTTCDITLSWTEHTVAISNSSTILAAPPTVSMVLHVQP
jgi:type IV pilus assembly protein PilV